MALVAAVVLLLLAFSAEPLGVWGDVHQWLPPLSAHLDPAPGPGLPLALLVAAAVVLQGPHLAATARWGQVLALTWAAGAVWGTGLALLRGWSGGIVAPLAHEDEYLTDVARVQDVGEVLRVYTDRILLTSPDHWTTHNSGHPPLPLLAYAGLDRIGLGGPGASGVVTALVGSTGVVAVLVTLRALGDERRARLAAPFLALTPLVIWTVVSADGAFMAVSAWGLALLALAATADRPGRGVALGVAAGFVLGVGIFLSYGLILMGPLAVAVLLAARSWRPLLPAVLAAVAVVAAFAAAGFWWLEGQQVLVVRYYQGKAAVRPYSYWVWGNLAVAVFTLGPAVVAGAGSATAARLGRLRASARPRPATARRACRDPAPAPRRPGSLPARSWRSWPPTSPACRSPRWSGSGCRSRSGWSRSPPGWRPPRTATWRRGGGSSPRPGGRSRSGSSSAPPGSGARRRSGDGAHAGVEATPRGRNRRPVTRSAMPVRSRYGVIPPRWNGQPAPRIRQRSMSCGVGDDALVQHQPRPRPRAPRAPVRGPASARRRRVARPEQRRDLRSSR